MPLIFCFHLIAAFSALALARRFSPHPLLATLLFLRHPAFVINGTSLEADVPFVALWLLSTALYVFAVDRRSMSLLHRLLRSRWRWPRLPRISPSCWSRSFSFTAENGGSPGDWRRSPPSPRFCRLAYLRAPLHRRSPGWHSRQLHHRLWARSAGAKDQERRRAHRPSGMARLPHLWIPPLVRAALRYRRCLLRSGIRSSGPPSRLASGILIRCARRWRDFLAQWVLIFFAGALDHFLRRLRALSCCPSRCPSRSSPRNAPAVRLLQISLACGFALSLTLAIVNYQHWDGYRQFARALRNDAQSKRLWINGEWGLRYYFESEGGLPLHQGQAIHPGEMVVSSKLSYPIPFTTGGGIARTRRRAHHHVSDTACGSSRFRATRLIPRPCSACAPSIFRSRPSINSAPSTDDRT